MSCASTSYKIVAKFKLIYLPKNWSVLVYKANEVGEEEVCGIDTRSFTITDYGLKFEGYVGNACYYDVISALRRLGELLGVEPQIRVKCL